MIKTIVIILTVILGILGIFGCVFAYKAGTVEIPQGFWADSNEPSGFPPDHPVTLAYKKQRKYYTISGVCSSLAAILSAVSQVL